MENEGKEKINIVCSGGEMRGGYVGGFLDSFVKEIDLSKFDVTFYCVSASVPTTLFYLSFGNDFYCEEVWTEALSKEGKRIYNSLLNLDMKGILRVFRDYHLNKENILNNPSTIIFPIFDIDTRENIFVSNKKLPGFLWIGDHDIYQLIHAAIAAPVLYGKSVVIDGREYCDPGLKTHFIIPDNNNKTIFILQNKGIAANKFISIFIFCYAFFSETLPYFWFSYFVFHKKKLYQEVKKRVKKGGALLFEPMHSLASQANMAFTRKMLRKNFSIGQKTFGKNKQKILDFLNK
jgi:predicted patatin/cPLA2 family phospholipase